MNTLLHITPDKHLSGSTATSQPSWQTANRYHFFTGSAY